MGVISDMLASVPGVKQDWIEDWKEDAREDWQEDWGAVAPPPPLAAPVNTVAPVASGTPAVGETLSTTNGTWTGNPAPTFTYQWFVDSTIVPGATSSSYVVQAGDVGFNVFCRVTATNTQGSASADSNSLGPVV